ncbi:MAG: hypothetical protein M1830_010144 [Pleopsidium flavum]|nr:MAG: hypothetical protein M1830_010144 [Pleopsidium flavum]
MSDLSPLEGFCFNVFCWPLKLYIKHLLNQPSRMARVHKPHVPREAPVPLPPREHRLSFTDENDSGTSDLRTTTSVQLQSRFFSLLPKELRLQIYEYVLGGRLLHVGFEDGDPMRASYLRRYPCLSGNDASTWDHSFCWGRRDTWREPLLPLLQSCRLVYNEAISILYCANTFSFKDSDCLKYFPTLVPRQRFEAIQSLKLYFYQWYLPLKDPTTKEYYDEIWRLIATMPRLRELRVQLDMQAPPPIPYWKVNEAAWLAPLKGFKGLQVFELDILLVEASQISKDIDVGECRIHALEEPGDE